MSDNLTVATTPTPTVYPFIFWEGQPQFITEKIEPLLRPGVDGQDFRLLGSWCDPFEIVSVESILTVALARAQYAVYEALKIADEAIAMNYLSNDLGDVQVLNVMQENISAAACIIGGDLGTAADVATGGSGFILRTKWRLVFV